MKEIALAILSVGLCFYEAYRLSKGFEIDALASLIAIIAAIMVIFS